MKQIVDAILDQNQKGSKGEKSRNQMISAILKTCVDIAKEDLANNSNPKKCTTLDALASIFDKQKKYLEDKMKSIGIFAVLYILPAGALLFCYFYEYVHLPEWMSTWQEDLCRYDKLRREWQIPCRISNHEWTNRESRGDIFRPNIYLLYIKYFSVLMIGILSGFWVWNQQMVNTWRTFFVNVTGGNESRKADSV